MNWYKLLFIPIIGLTIQANSSLVFGSLVLSVDTPTLNGNSANATSGNSGQLMAQNLSSIAVTNSGGSVASTVGNFVDGSVRYALINTIDRDNNGGGSGATRTHAWQLSFSVTAPIGQLYNLSIDTSRIGALTVRRDNGNLVGFGRADLGAMTGTFSGPGTITGSLNLAAIQPGLIGAGTTNPTTEETQVNQFTSLTVTDLVGTGVAQTFTLDFNWDTVVETTGGFSIFGGGASSHEGAVRMGLATTAWASQIPAATAGGVGGVPFRDIANDGHFVSIRASVVPEPSSALLALTGLVGLVGSRRRRG